MKILNRVAVPLFSIWLISWMVLSWGGVQDDALIHLRYARFLYRVHFITYDGVHPSYGTSSLLYVSTLALLRSLTGSPLLARGVSTFAHLCLFAVVAFGYLRSVRAASVRVQLLGLSLLLLLIVPSAVRWLDDGMETGIAMGLVGIVVWWTHRLSLRQHPQAVEFLPPILLGVLLVFLRSELGIVALFACAILCTAAAGNFDSRWFSRILQSVPARCHFLLGAVLGAVAIRLVMHSFLPDTARAKSHGIHGFLPTLSALPHIVVGALVFGVGSLVLWLLSAMIVLTRSRVRLLPTLIANALFPFVLLASALRGQEIQGFRYLTWSLFFSILWNFLELRHIDSSVQGAMPAVESRQRGAIALGAFLGCCLVALPVDVHFMYRLLTARARTMRLFMGEDLASALHGQEGIAGDVGYISYFSQGSICDLAGLVNGAAAAALTPAGRLGRCVAEHPVFAFLNAGQTAMLMPYIDFTRWCVCGQYDFGNMSQPDRHFLLVDPQYVAAVCNATDSVPAPISLALANSTYR